MEVKLPPLDVTDAIRLRAAEGWLELGDALSASDELDELTAEGRSHPATLLIRCQIYIKAKKWDMAAEVSEPLIHLLPNVSETWVNFAYALRRKNGGSVEQAKEILLKAEPLFPRQYIFPFNLACYCSQLGQFEETERWLKKAMSIDTRIVQQMAVTDDDLKPFWESMNGTLWKKNHPGER